MKNIHSHSNANEDGEWRDGLCDCCQECSTCCGACWCSFVPLAQLYEHVFGAASSANSLLHRYLLKPRSRKMRPRVRPHS